MPASTFTLAVGHWRQVLAENPAASDRVARDETDCGGTATLGAGPGERARADLLSGPSSISEVVKGSPVRTGRYFIICSLCVFFLLLLLQTVINPSLALQHSTVKLSFRHTKNGAGEARGAVLNQIFLLL